MKPPIQVRWHTADGKPVNPADPELREMLRRSLEEFVRRMLDPDRRAA